MFIVCVLFAHKKSYPEINQLPVQSTDSFWQLFVTKMKEFGNYLNKN